jgi:hypothetical protein
MENRVIILKNDDGSLETIYLNNNTSIERCIESYSLNEKEHIYLEKEDVPMLKNFEYYKAYELINSIIEINMPKARDIHRVALRSERASRLAALDVAYMRAQEREDTAAAKQIAAQKETLRNIPTHPAIDAAQTPEELMALTLDVLLAL